MGKPIDKHSFLFSVSRELEEPSRFTRCSCSRVFWNCGCQTIYRVWKCIDIFEPRVWDSICLYCSWEGWGGKLVTICCKRRNTLRNASSSSKHSWNGHIWNIEYLVFLEVWAPMLLSCLDNELVRHWLEFSSTGYDAWSSLCCVMSYCVWRTIGWSSPFSLLVPYACCKVIFHYAWLKTMHIEISNFFFILRCVW